MGGGVLGGAEAEPTLNLGSGKEGVTANNYDITSQQVFIIMPTYTVLSTEQ